MSINAVISNEISTHIGNFSVNIAFAKDVTDFDISDVTFTAVSGNGVTNINRTLSGSGATYMVNVSVPGAVSGSFSVEITGQVMVDGTAERVVATIKTFRYDTIFDVRTAFLPLRYNDDEIILPIQYDEDVLWFDKSDLFVEKRAGTEAYLLEHYVRGVDADYEVVFHPARGTWGAIGVDITGEVIKESDLVREIVSVDPVLISYNNLLPTLADVDTPFMSEDGWWNVGLSFEYPVVGFGIHSIITGIEHSRDFIYRGLSMDVKPENMPPAFSDVYPFAEVSGQHCVGDWEYVDLMSTEQGRYFWVKLHPNNSGANSDEVPEILLKDVNGLRPVSVAI